MNMKVFLIASIYGKDVYTGNYEKIVEIMEELGHSIQADHILGVTKSDLDQWDEDKNLVYHKKVLDGIKRADVIIGELSYSSTSVGYLLSLALESGKPTIIVYTGAEEPHILKTLSSNDKFQSIRYSENDYESLRKELKSAIEYSEEVQDTRFNFFISPKIGNYLDCVSKKKRLPRAVYLRKLIEEDMKKNREFEE